MEAGDVTPAELHLLGRPDLGGPAFFVRDGLLEQDKEGLGQRVVAEAQALQRGRRLRAAGMSRGAGRWADTSYRGDEMAWLIPSGAEADDYDDYDNDDDDDDAEAAAAESAGGSGILIPTLRIPKASAIHAAVAQLEQVARRLDALDRRGPGPPLLRLDAGLRKSVQLAYYPGDGRRYVRHRDAFPPSPEAKAKKREDGDGEGEATRCLTIICYLNPHWQPEHGGRLRLFLPAGDPKAAEPAPGREADAEADAEAAPSPSPCWEVDPQLGRVVVFRSDVVEHEVLPAWAPRFALTCWFYGRPRHTTTPPRAPLPTPVPVAALLAAFAGNGGGDTGPSTACTPAAGTAEGGKEEGEGDSAWTTTAPPLPIEEAEGKGGRGEGAWAAQSILVSVVAYRDSECQHTLHSLFASARHPDRVSVGLVWQGDGSEEEEARCFGRPLPPRWAKRVRTLRMDHREAAGPCWARHLGQALWQGERFLLQIDSYMRFRPNWDSYLVAALTRGCPSPDQGRRAVLTTYPIGYELLPGSLDARVPTDVRPTLLCPSKVRKEKAGKTTQGFGLWPVS
jgi:hypothetical protein